MRLLILLASVLLLGIEIEADAELDLLKKARILYNEAKFAEAIDVYQEIIRNNPQDIEPYLNLICLYKDLAEYERAIELINQAMEHFDDVRLELFLGRILCLDGKSKQAILHMERLLSSGAKGYYLLLYLGFCHEDIGEFAEAESCYLNTIKLNPDSTLAYFRLGGIYYQNQRYGEAAEVYQKILSLDPSIPGVRMRLAECFLKQGEFEHAYKEYARCIAISPGDKYIQRRLEEVKSRLGESFFRQKESLVSWRRRKRSIQVKASPFAEMAPQVRIGVAKIKNSFEFKCGGSFEIVDKQSGELLYKGNKETVYRLTVNRKSANFELKDAKGKHLLEYPGRSLLIRNESKNSTITIFDLSYGRGNFWAGWHDWQYRGVIEVVPQGDIVHLINLVNLEEYLYGVLPSEMPADWPDQALRAQAIAARTWAIRNKTRHHTEGFNFCNTVHCQVYKGAQAEKSSTNEAVDSTSGMILVSDGKPIDIFYSNNCGGCTREGIMDTFLDPEFHFLPSPLELENWLMGRPQAFCNLKKERAANFRWTRCYERRKLQAMLARFDIDVGEILGVVPQRRAGSGHLISIEIRGTKRRYLLKGENNIRKVLGNLLSSAFKIEIKFSQQHLAEEFIFYGGGFGHARGLCQSGAKGMALKGYDYIMILNHYYPDAEIERIY